MWRASSSNPNLTSFCVFQWEKMRVEVTEMCALPLGTRNQMPSPPCTYYFLLNSSFFQRSTVLIGLCCALASIRVCGYLHARLTTLNRWPQMKVNIIVLNVECELRVVNFFHRRVIVRFRNLIVHTARSLIINALIILHWSDNNFLFFLLPLSLLYTSLSLKVIACTGHGWHARTIRLIISLCMKCQLELKSYEIAQLSSASVCLKLLILPPF